MRVPCVVFLLRAGRSASLLLRVHPARRGCRPAFGFAEYGCPARARALPAPALVPALGIVSALALKLRLYPLPRPMNLGLEVEASVLLVRLEHLGVPRGDVLQGGVCLHPKDHARLLQRHRSSDLNMDAAPPLAASCATPERCASVKVKRARRRVGVSPGRGGRGDGRGARGSGGRRGEHRHRAGTLQRRSAFRYAAAAARSRTWPPVTMRFAINRDAMVHERAGGDVARAAPGTRKKGFGSSARDADEIRRARPRRLVAGRSGGKCASVASGEPLVRGARPPSRDRPGETPLRLLSTSAAAGPSRGAVRTRPRRPRAPRAGAPARAPRALDVLLRVAPRVSAVRATTSARA